jgi:hypothetical protein
MGYPDSTLKKLFSVLKTLATEPGTDRANLAIALGQLINGSYQLRLFKSEQSKYEILKIIEEVSTIKPENEVYIRSEHIAARQPSYRMRLINAIELEVAEVFEASIHS